MDHNPFRRRGKLRGRELLASPTKGQRRDLSLGLLLPSLWDGAASLSCCRCRCCTSVVSDSETQRRQPTRLLRPWDSPGKSTGVGCHRLFRLLLLLPANPHQVPEPKPGLLPRPWKAPLARRFSLAKGHTHPGPKPSGWTTDLRGLIHPLLC